MKNRQTKERVWHAVIILTVLIIWGQSLLGQELSAMQSSSVQGFLGKVFGDWIYDTFLYTHIRKVAHFAEYAVLGAECMSYRAWRRDANLVQWRTAAFGLAIAVCDELLQFISARAPGIKDVLLDMAGYICGGMVVFSVIWLYRCVRKQKSVK